MLYPLSYGGKMLEIIVFYWRGRIPITLRVLLLSKLPASVAPDESDATPTKYEGVTP